MHNFESKRMAGVYYNYVLNGYIMVPIIIILWCYNRSGCRPIVASAGSNRETVCNWEVSTWKLLLKKLNWMKLKLFFM